MRKIILMMSVSLDGFIEGPDRELDWQMVDDELHGHFNEQLSAMGAFLSGRVTYELMAKCWPTADTDPSSTGPMVEFARIWRDMLKIVFSRTLERADWNTTVIRDVVAEEVMELKAQPGGDLVLGGADIAAAFMRHDLIDEYRLYVHPVVIGQGKPLFQASDTKVNLQLAETRTFGNGVVLLRYQRPTHRGNEGVPGPLITTSHGLTIFEPEPLAPVHLIGRAWGSSGTAAPRRPEQTELAVIGCLTRLSSHGRDRTECHSTRGRRSRCQDHCNPTTQATSASTTAGITSHGLTNPPER